MVRLTHPQLAQPLYARKDEFEQALEDMRAMHPIKRAECMETINECVEDWLDKCRSRPLKPREAQLMIEDVGLWYINEVIEGRQIYAGEIPPPERRH